MPMLFKLVLFTLLFFSFNVKAKQSSWGETPEDVLRQTQAHLKAGPDDVALFHQGVAYADLNQWNKAQIIFQDLSLKHVDWPEPKNNLAVALLKQGQLEKAQKVIDDAINSQPSFRVAQKNRNSIYEYLAAQAYDKVLGNGKKASLPEMDLLTELTMNRPDVKEKPVDVKPEVVIVKQPRQNDWVNHIRQHLLAWSRAWSESDEKHYFSSYSTKFRPTDLRKDYTRWRNIRRVRLRNTPDVQVVLDNIDIYLSDNRQRAVAEFVQSYSSSKYKDRVIKQLVLEFDKGNWLILSEREIQKLD